MFAGINSVSYLFKILNPQNEFQPKTPKNVFIFYALNFIVCQASRSFLLNTRKREFPQYCVHTFLLLGTMLL